LKTFVKTVDVALRFKKAKEVLARTYLSESDTDERTYLHIISYPR